MKRTSKKNKPYWERAYRGHAYWLGKQKLGRITLRAAQDLNSQGKYQWEAAGKTGFSDELEKAKAAVELAVSTTDKQLDLFR
ncbi:MAG TPA: hypothetical protein VGT43_04615 [Burkholderiales bacterium]|nr:hypothetical protein [Burkholderiales bacterium]